MRWPIRHGGQGLVACEAQANIERTALMKEQGQIATECIPWFILRLTPRPGGKIKIDSIRTVPTAASLPRLLKDHLIASSEAAWNAVRQDKPEAETKRRDVRDMAEIAEADRCFVVVMQGVRPWAGVVEGIDGVRDALTQIVCNDPQPLLLGELTTAIASLRSLTGRRGWVGDQGRWPPGYGPARGVRRHAWLLASQSAVYARLC